MNVVLGLVQSQVFCCRESDRLRSGVSLTAIQMSALIDFTSYQHVHAEQTCDIAFNIQIRLPLMQICS